MFLNGQILPDTLLQQYGTNQPTNQVTQTDPWGKWADLIGVGVTAYNQQQLLEVNVERAKQGLPPISASEIAPTVNVGISPEIKQLLIMGGVGLLLLFLLTRKKS